LISDHATQAALVISCILLIAAIRHYRPDAVIHDVSIGFTAAAIAAMAAAVLRQERAGRGSLNGWDESLAFNGLALLVRVLHHAS
jgi:hypothetical protein